MSAPEWAIFEVLYFVSRCEQRRTLCTAKAQSIQEYFKDARSHLTTLEGDDRIASALRSFPKAEAEFDPALDTPEVDAELSAFYETQFLPELAKTSAGKPDVKFYMPITPFDRWLPDQYIVKNPHTPDERWKLERGAAESAYATVHQRIHAHGRWVITICF